MVLAPAGSHLLQTPAPKATSQQRARIWEDPRGSYPFRIVTRIMGAISVMKLLRSAVDLSLQARRGSGFDHNVLGRILNYRSSACRCQSCRVESAREQTGGLRATLAGIQANSKPTRSGRPAARVLITVDSNQDLAITLASTLARERTVIVEEQSLGLVVP